jgi:hypothetical protein
MDIRKTGDSPLDIIVTHDKSTGRTCDLDWMVCEKNVAELQTLDAAYHFDPLHDQSFPLRGQGVVHPTLESVFALFAEKKSPGASMWIDTKDDEQFPIEENQGLYDRLVELIGRYGLWAEALIEVGAAEQAESLRGRDNRVQTVFWGKTEEAIRAALGYEYYVRIGLPPALAVSLAEAIHATGKKVHVTAKRVSAELLEDLAPVEPDSLGTVEYQKAIELLGVDAA